MTAAHHSLFCARMKEVTQSSGIIFPTLISEPSLKLEGSLHKMPPRLLNSTTEYGQPSCFGHLKVQLNVNHRFHCKGTIQLFAVSSCNTYDVSRGVDNFWEVGGLSLYRTAGSHLRMVRPSLMLVVKLVAIRAHKACGKVLDLVSYLAVRWCSHCTSASN